LFLGYGARTLIKPAKECQRLFCEILLSTANANFLNKIRAAVNQQVACEFRRTGAEISRLLREEGTPFLVPKPRAEAVREKNCPNSQMISNKVRRSFLLPSAPPSESKFLPSLKS